MNWEADMKNMTIRTPDGEAPAWLFRPCDATNDTNGLPGVVFYMDGMGTRKALFDMAQRLADAGYVVLLPDLFYRFGAYGPFTHGSFADEKARNQILGMVDATTYEMTVQDTTALLAVLRSENGGEQFGAVGYCFGGGRVLRAASSFPGEIVAAASFHGGNLASPDPQSPHHFADKIAARVYVGMAGLDGSFPPEQSAILTESLRTGGVDFIVENYVGMNHGWTVPDRDGVYDENGDKRHWSRLLGLFSETLGGGRN